MNVSNSKSKPESGALPSATRSFIQTITLDILQKDGNGPHDKLPFDQDLYDECQEVLESEYNLPLSLYTWFKGYLSFGCIFVFACYSHLPKSKRVHVAIYVALSTALDDTLYHHIDYKKISAFNERFVKGLPQDDPILDALAKCLLDMSEYCNQVQSSMVVTGTLDFVTALVVDMDIQNMTTEDFKSPGFAAYWRLTMSGFSVPFTMLVFPKELEVKTYIQLRRQMVIYMTYLNDALSLYKEELQGEEDTFVTMLAKESRISKYEAVSRIADEAAKADHEILEGLAENQSALDSWLSFRNGYVPFHITSGRFKLDELFEDSRKNG